jgi:hypothetical protein
LLAWLPKSPENLAVTMLSITGEPTLSDVRKGVQVARAAGCDLVIALGGGSAIDAGKAIAAMLTNDGELLDYLEIIGAGRVLTRPGAPFHRHSDHRRHGRGGDAQRRAGVAQAPMQSQFAQPVAPAQGGAG